MALAYSLLMEAGNLAVTVMIALELSGIRRDLKRAEGITVRGSPFINMVREWVI